MTHRTRIVKAVGKVIAVAVLVILGLLVVAAVIIAVAFSRLDETNGVIVSSGQERTYLLFVPTTYDPATPTPLVISLHGFAEWPAHQMQISGWNDLAEEYGFIVVYPSGTGFPKRWRAGGQSGDWMVDVLFISDLIDELGREYNIDSARVFANGLSNGGGFSYMLGCTLSDRIAAVGSVSGAYLFPLDECKPCRPVPMIAFHGTGDSIVPYQGGPSMFSGASFPAILDWIAARAKLNGCQGSPADLTLSAEVSELGYSDCSQGADVVLYTIVGGGHAWPGGEPMPEWIVGYTTQQIDATRVMWEFFSRFSMED